MRHSIRFALLVAATCVACGDESSPGLVGPDENRVCEPFETELCECPVTSGTRYCNAQGTGYSECSCPIQSAVVRNDVPVVTFEESRHAVNISDRTLRLDPADPLSQAQPGDILVSFDGAGFLGRVVSSQQRDGEVWVETEAVALADAFEELEVEINHEAPLEVWLPPEIRRELAADPLALGRGGIGGLDIGATGSIVPGFRIREGSRLDLDGPKIEAGFSIGETGKIDVGLFDIPKIGLRSFKFIVKTGIDTRINSTISLEANASGWVSLELIEAVLTAAGYEYLAPARYPIGGGIEATFFFYLECGVSVTGQAELDTFVEVDTEVEAGLRYNFDRSPKWRAVGDGNVDSDAGVEDFDWRANGEVLCQIKPEVELSILRSGGPFVNGGPYFLTQGQAGPRYRIEIGGGFRGDVGGRVSVLDFGTVWEETWELFDFYQEFYGQDFAVCGDGYLQIGEECDPGFLVDTDECTSSCECGERLAPRPDDIGPDDNLDNRPGGWTEFNYEGRVNGCKPTCGNGIVEPEEGEVCDDGFFNNRLQNAGTCNETCTRQYCVCGDGIVDDGGGFAFETQSVSFREGRVVRTRVVTYDQCAEVCDDGNTVGGDGCRADCLGAETCGDYFLDPGEECDLGAGNGSTWCLDGCVLDLGCGDGRVAPGEECDSGGVNTAECDFDCTFAVCGDAYQNTAAGESCDATPGDHGACDPDCTPNQCGDGYVGVGEACDDGGASATCDIDCTPVVCGDGTLNPEAGEECEFLTGSGPANTGQCDADCTRPVCGDGVVNAAANETCDDGDQDDCTPECGSGCQGPGNTCGDGLQRCDEVCDDGNTASGDGCRGDCMGREVCGDGLVDPGEVCDDGNTVSGDGCRGDCAGFEICGDNLVDVGEACDDGNADNCEGACLADCSGERADSCGDGVIDEPCPGCDVCEVCEDTVPDNSDVDLGCTAAAPNCNECGECSTDVCGDGLIGPTELCDGLMNVGFCFDDAGDYVRCTPANGMDPGDQTGCAADSPCRRVGGACVPDPDERGCVRSGPESCLPDAECQLFVPFAGECNTTCDRIVTCGDGFVDGAEQCEPTCIGGALDQASCFGADARTACAAGGGACSACTDDCRTL